MAHKFGMKQVSRGKFGVKSALNTVGKFGSKYADLASGVAMVAGQPEVSLGIEVGKRVANALER